MVEWESVIIGLIPGVVVAISIFAYTREIKIGRLGLEHQQTIKHLEFENGQRMKTLETQLDLSTQYDIRLRESRIEVYSKSWKLQPMAKYARPDPVTYMFILDLWKSAENGILE